jgi:DNA repair exonuclease SbcCD ATPase subunit
LNSINEPLNSINESLILIKEALNSIKESLNSIKEALNSINEPLNSINESLILIKEALNSIKEALNSINKSSDTSFPVYGWECLLAASTSQIRGRGAMKYISRFYLERDLNLETRFIKILAIAIPIHLYNKKTVTMSDNYILKRISAYRQQILKENKEICLSLNQIIGY